MKLPYGAPASILATVTALVLAVAAGCSTTPSSAPALAEDLVGVAAPSLSGPLLTGDEELALASMAGKPTAVIFWFAQCPHCQETLPALDDAWSEVEGDANVLTVGIPHPDADIEATAGFESPEAFVATTGLSLPTILGDWDSAVSDWMLEGVPTVFVLDANHVVQQVMVGPDAAAIIDAVRDV